MLGCCEIWCHCGGSAVRNAVDDAVKMPSVGLDSVNEWSWRQLGPTLQSPAMYLCEAYTVMALGGLPRNAIHSAICESFEV
jgi:hypothetical protein